MNGKRSYNAGLKIGRAVGTAIKPFYLLIINIKRRIRKWQEDK